MTNSIQDVKLPSRPCRECKTIYPIDEFIYKGKTHFGKIWYGKCRKCRAADNKSYNRQNIERMRIYWREYARRSKLKILKRPHHEKLYWTNLWHECGNDPIKFTEAFKAVGGFKRRGSASF